MTLDWDEAKMVAVELHGRMGECLLDAGKVESIVGLPSGSFPSNLPALDKSREETLRRLNQVCALVLGLRQDNAGRWFNMPRPDLGRLSPIEAMLDDVRLVAVIRNRLRDELDPSIA